MDSPATVKANFFLAIFLLRENIGVRHGQVLFLFAGYTISFLFRSVMAVSIVAMTDKDSENPNVTIFDWDSSKQSLILSSLLWGCVVSQVPIGFLVQNLGGTHKVLCFAMFVNSLMMIFTPIAATELDWIAVLLIRVIIGVCQGALIPCSKILITKWIPLFERAQFGSLILNGGQLGNVLSLLLSGILAGTSFGWPSIFYTFGVIGMTWSLLYWFFGGESPAHHKSISLIEKEFIEKSLGGASEEKLPFPWKAVLVSLPVWSLVFTEICQIWSYYMLLSEMPSFMKNILKFDIEQTGILSSLPYLAKWLLAFPIGWISDNALRKGYSVTLIRKASNSIGMWGPGLMLLILCLVDSSKPTLPVSLMILAVGLNAGNMCGQEINEIDIAPNFVGILSSIINSIAKIFGFLAPIAFGIIVKNPENFVQWQIIFYTSVVTYFLGNLVFLIFGKAKPQPWNGETTSPSSSWNENVKRMSIISRISNVHES